MNALLAQQKLGNRVWYADTSAGDPFEGLGTIMSTYSPATYTTASSITTT